MASLLNQFAYPTEVDKQEISHPLDPDSSSTSSMLGMNSVSRMDSAPKTNSVSRMDSTPQSNRTGERIDKLIDECIRETVEKYIVNKVDKLLSAGEETDRNVTSRATRELPPPSRPVAVTVPAREINVNYQTTRHNNTPFSDTTAKKLLLLMIVKAIEFSVYILMLNLSISSLWFVPIHIGSDWDANIEINYWLISGCSPSALYLYFSVIMIIMLCAIYGCRVNMMIKLCWILFYIFSAAIFIAVQIVFFTCIIVYEYGRDITIDNFFGFLIMTACIAGVAIVIFVIMSAITYCCMHENTHGTRKSYESNREYEMV